MARSEYQGAMIFCFTNVTYFGQSLQVEHGPLTTSFHFSDVGPPLLPLPRNTSPYGNLQTRHLLITNSSFGPGEASLRSSTDRLRIRLA